MLRAAKEISNLNEFVYLAKEISRMLKEEVSALPALPVAMTLVVLMLGQRTSDAIDTAVVVRSSIVSVPACFFGACVLNVGLRLTSVITGRSLRWA